MRFARLALLLATVGACEPSAPSSDPGPVCTVGFVAQCFEGSRQKLPGDPCLCGATPGGCYLGICYADRCAFAPPVDGTCALGGCQGTCQGGACVPNPGCAAAVAP